MPTHEEDIQLIACIQQSITNKLATYPSHFLLLARDYKHDIFRIRQYNQQSPTPPSHKDNKWQTFISNLHFLPILDTTPFTRQAGPNYNHTNLIDAFYMASTHLPLTNVHSHTTLPQLKPFLSTLSSPPHPPKKIKDFITEILVLLNRYITLLPRKEPPHIPPP